MLSKYVVTWVACSLAVIATLTTERSNDSGSDTTLISEILDFMDEGNGSLAKRAFEQTPDHMSFLWNRTTDGEETRLYNFTVLLSGCGSIRRDLEIGPYIYVNGTFQDNASVGDILDDVRIAKKKAKDLHEARRTLINHALKFGLRVRNDTKEVLDHSDSKQSNSTICKSSISVSTSVNEIIHTELRRLLWRPDLAFLMTSTVVLGRATLFGGGTAFVSYKVQMEKDHPFFQKPDPRNFNESTIAKPALIGGMMFITTLMYDLMSRAPFADPQDTAWADDMMRTFFIYASLSFGALWILPLMLSRLWRSVRTIKSTLDDGSTAVGPSSDPSDKSEGHLYTMMPGSLDPIPVNENATAAADWQICVSPDLAAAIAYGGQWTPWLNATDSSNEAGACPTRGGDMESAATLGP